MIRVRSWLASAALSLAAASGAAAQQPPVADDKQTSTPAPPATQEQATFVDNARQWATDNKLAERIDGSVDGWYPRFGGIRRGSGVAGGAGYRFHTGSVLVDLSAAISVRNYRVFDAHVMWLESRSRRAQLWTDYAYDNYPRERYFGLGNDTVEDARASYGLRNNTFTLRGVLRPASRLQLTGSVGYMHPHVRRGSDEEHPPLLDIATDIDAPSLLSQPGFVQTQINADLDLRDTPGFATSGGVYHAGFGRWNAQGRDQFDFNRFDATAAQFIPVTADKRHVVIGRVGLSAANADDGARVPFYFLPYVGGRDTVRSFVEYRFSGEDALWYGGEYRWTVRKNISVAAFTDRGKVSRTWGSLDSGDTKAGYGFSVIGHSSKQTFARVDTGFGGGEGWHVWVWLGGF